MTIEQRSARRPGRDAAQEAANAMPPLAQVTGGSVEQKVYNAIRVSLMTGQVLPGSKLSTRTLSERFGISAMPVREALKRLQADGVLTSGSRRAYVVRRLTAADYADIIDIRVSLEGLAAERACRNATPADIEELEQLNALYGASFRVPSWSVKANYDFHFKLYSLSRSPSLVEIIENVWVRVAPILHMAVRESDYGVTTEHHRDIIDAVARRDGEAAKAALRQDFEGVLPPIIRLLSERDGAA
ncbi:MAG: GntR family transcriptional regulator [Azospirillaceae bacterium]